MKNNTALWTSLILYGALGGDPSKLNPNRGLPKIDYSKINPPRTEESKQYYLKKAEEKRLRKLRKRG